MFTMHLCMCTCTVCVFYCLPPYRSPYKYDKAVLPVKLPPVKQQLSIPNLPMLGYLEQSVAVCIINGLTAVGCFKPKFPFISASQSAQLYLALHLKGIMLHTCTNTTMKYSPYRS